MRPLHWCMLAVTILLLVCEVTVSQLCKSLITLVDGFHTLSIFMCMALPRPPPQIPSIMKRLRSSVDVPASPPRNSSSSAEPASALTPLPGSQIHSNAPAGTREPPCPQPGHEASSLVQSHQVLPPPAPACGVSYTSSRVQPVGAFFSALLLASLCASYLIQIISFTLDPHPALHPLILVLVGSVSLLHKTLLLRLNWDQLLVRVHKQPEAESHIEVNHRDSENDSQASSVWTSSHHIRSPAPSRQLPACLLPFVVITQGLLTSLLALSYSLVMLLIGPQSLHGAGTCGLLVYLDPALSLLAVVMLIATVRPQMCRYGLMLLQATPPHIYVSELERRIAGVPGVQAVHDLHVWQLAESLTVASVHVHCSATLPAHRCAELMSGVTKVLQGVGVSCCTVQPEFTSCSVSSGDRGCDASPVVDREEPSLPPALACSLACGKACAASMCCSPRDEEASSLLAPPAGASEEQPQSLVIENTFL